MTVPTPWTMRGTPPAVRAVRRLAHFGLRLFGLAHFGLALFSPAFASLAAAPLAAQQRLTGAVISESGTPIEDARVLLVEMDRAISTDAEGRFSLTSVADGAYTLQVSRFGFRTAVISVTVPSAASLRVTLAAAAFPLDPVNVTIARSPLNPQASPLPTSVLDAQDLARDRSESLARTIEKLPGVRNLSTGQEIGKPIIRGLSGARVLVLSQGMRLEDYSWSDEDGPAVDAAMADRIEVIRGPASVLYGADAVGGVVNIVPRPLPDASGGAGFTKTDAELSFASNNKETGAVLRAEGASGPWGWRVMGNGRVAEALHTPLAELENTGFGAVNAEGALVRRGTWGTFTARVVHNGGEFKLLEEDAPPGGDAGMEEEGGPERKLMDDRLQLLGNFPLGGATRLETRVQAQRHNIIEMEDLPNADPHQPKTEVEAFNLTLSTGLGEVLLHHALIPGSAGTIGATGKLQSSATSGALEIIPGASNNAAGAFVLERYETGPVTLLGGARADVVNIGADGQTSRSFKALTWSAGAAWDLLDGLTLTGNVGTAWRAPTLFELYAEGPRLGEGRYEIGRGDLEAETSLNLDAGLRVRVDRLHLEVSTYQNNFTDFLYIQPTAEVRDGYQVYRYQQAEAVLHGAEGSVQIEVTPMLSVTGRGDYVYGQNQARDEPLPLMPPVRAVGGAEVHGAWPSSESWAYVGGEVEYVAAPARLNPLDYDVDAYSLINAHAGVRGTWMGRESSVDLQVRNLMSVEYKDFLSRYKRFALNPGRDVVLRLRMAF